MTTAAVGSGLQITFPYAQGETFPSAFVSALNYAAQQIESLITTPISVSLNVSFDNSHPNVLGWSQPPLAGFDYTEVKDALAHIDPSAAASMPASEPFNGGNMLWLAAPQAAALGLNNPIATEGDFGQFDDIGFTASYNYSFDPNNRAVAGEYDFIGIAEHEITEALGRVDISGTQANTITNQGNLYTLLDMFHYTAPGVNTYVGTEPNYFSNDGGNNEGLSFNTQSNGDFNDWASGAGNGAFAAFIPSGAEMPLSQGDTSVLMQSVTRRGSKPLEVRPWQPFQ